MNQELRNAVTAAEKEAQYDASAKRLLGNKKILAHILVRTVEEFKGMDPNEVCGCIEGEPYISTVPLDPGLTNQRKQETEPCVKGDRIVGLNTEQGERGEGVLWFDILFYVRMKDGLSQIIVNVEAQKDEPKQYDILNRAVFYVSRLISSQKEREFQKSNYNEIKRVYSIWVCMNRKENSLNHIHLTNDVLLGASHWKGDLGLLNIVMIGLSKNLPERSLGVELHRLLGALLSQNLPVGEKLAIMEEEYEISMEKSEREDVSIMCNLSQGIKEEGFAEGLEAGMEIGRSEGREAGIQAMIEDNLEEGTAPERMKEKLMRHFGLNAEHAERYLERFAR